LKDAKDQFLTEEVEFWKRDPVECIKELISNPLFKEWIKYAPYRVFNAQENGEGKNRGYDEAATADDWWNLQVR
jgi:hypothetical protein